MTSPLQIWHPYTQKALDPPPLRVVRAQGVYLHTGDGRKLIDGISSWWVNLHGHCHPAMVAAIAEQAAKLDHVLLAGFTHEAVEELCARLRPVLPPELDHIFFSDNGSTAVEVALKAAVQYWRNVGRPKKASLVALEHAYHGDTAGVMSVSAQSVFTEAFAGLMFPVHRVHSAYCYQCPLGLDRARCHIDCVDKLARLLEEKHDEIAAVIVEPLLQGAGGMIVHPVEFLQRVWRLCREHEVLLIADEVLTGFGRCGTMFACELAGVTPDLMCLSKGLTGGFLAMGATVTTARIHDAFVSTDRTRTFFHGHSYTGNPLAAIAAVASLKIFATEPVFERIQRIAAVHARQLPGLRAHPAVGDVRQIGTVAALELKANDAGYTSKLRERLYDFFLRSGILLRPMGNLLYILPPYAITSEELEYIYSKVREALNLCLAA
jgi:adenosylmethionine-8-amino-7-oxononanoate aminotransferase